MTPFKPITREMAAEILSISLSTLDTMLAAGIIPPPRTIGGRRQYWHPADFYGWLEKKLRGDAETEVTQPHEMISPAATKTGRKRSKMPPGIADHARARNAERLSRLNKTDE
jgi:predicted DNA-binding transcriptional regulator AlpA